MQWRSYLVHRSLLFKHLFEDCNVYILMWIVKLICVNVFMEVRIAPPERWVKHENCREFAQKNVNSLVYVCGMCAVCVAFRCEFEAHLHICLYGCIGHVIYLYLSTDRFWNSGSVACILEWTSYSPKWNLWRIHSQCPYIVHSHLTQIETRNCLLWSIDSQSLRLRLLIHYKKACLAAVRLW